MKSIGLLTATAGVIACLAFGGMPAYGTSQDADLEAEAWMLEQGVQGALTDVSASFGACYELALSDVTPRGVSAALVDTREHLMTAATCDPTFLLTSD